MKNLPAEAVFILLIVVIILIIFFIIFMEIFGDKLEKKTSKNLNKKIYSQKSFSSFSFWNGQKGLALTFWGFFIGGNILFNAATIIFADNPTLIIMNLVIFVIWNVLSVMGVFNAADIYKAAKIKQGLPYTPATAAKVAVVLLILSGIGNSIPK
jgi:magnesium-transporting ATPase (P-type)